MVRHRQVIGLWDVQLLSQGSLQTGQKMDADKTMREQQKNWDKLSLHRALSTLRGWGVC